MRIHFILLLLSFIYVVEATNGSDFIAHGTKQSGVAGAGAARAEDSTWIGINPAAITELERNTFDIHYEYFSPRRTIEMDGIGSNPNRETTRDKAFIPNMSLSYKLSETETVGFGLYTFAGADTHLENSRSFLGDLDGYDTFIDYWTMKLQAVYAKKLGSGWSVGAGPSLIFSRIRTDMQSAAGTQTEGEGEWDDSWGGGFTLGVHKSWEKFAWGLGYSSPQWTESFDKYDDVMSAVEHPQFIQTGISYKLTDELIWLVDYKWIDWDDVNVFKNKGSEGGYGWSEQHIVKTGLVWDVTDKTTLRTGYSYGRSSMNSDGVYVNSLFPTPIEHHITFGLTHEVTENMEVTLSYIHGFKKGFTENKKDLQFGEGTDVSLAIDMIGLGITWYF
ncbi:MAG: outer membrane protein transport protein [Lentisphaerales bacterium]|nr:outer membrane protein transport protein [Lentisphaerales bacterium]